jgi:Holliday junction DNA helicase RuvB
MKPLANPFYGFSECLKPKKLRSMSSSPRLVAHEFCPEDPDLSLRPLRLCEFIGQDSLKNNLQIFIDAARTRQKALDHVLFVGPPGLGKTTLAQIIARELGVNFHSTSGPILAKAGDLAAQLSHIGERDVLFIDEIHRLSPAVEEVLYPAMEDYQLDVMIGSGPTARAIKLNLPPFTLVGATTRQGLLTTPLRDRFGIPIRLSFYEVSALETIVKRAAHILHMTLDDEGANEIAKRSRGTPRIAGRLLRRVCDFALVDGHALITREIADHALTLLDVDPLGLDEMDRRYLVALSDTFSGGPAGIETLAAFLAEPRDALEEIVEPFLMQNGFVYRTPRGRTLSQEALNYLKTNALRRKPCA